MRDISALFLLAPGVTGVVGVCLKSTWMQISLYELVRRQNVLTFLIVTIFLQILLEHITVELIDPCCGQLELDFSSSYGTRHIIAFVRCT